MKLPISLLIITLGVFLFSPAGDARACSATMECKCWCTMQKAQGEKVNYAPRVTVGTRDVDGSCTKPWYVKGCGNCRPDNFGKGLDLCENWFMDACVEHCEKYVSEYKYVRAHLDAWSDKGLWNNDWRNKPVAP